LDKSMPLTFSATSTDHLASSSSFYIRAYACDIFNMQAVNHCMYVSMFNLISYAVLDDFDLDVICIIY